MFPPSFNQEYISYANAFFYCKTKRPLYSTICYGDRLVSYVVLSLCNALGNAFLFNTL